MVYNPESHICCVEDVKIFFHHLVNERSLNFHPDDDFAEYVNLADDTPSFSESEVTLYNRLMDESFAVCDANDVDIYEIGYDELSKGIGTID